MSLSLSHRVKAPWTRVSCSCLWPALLPAATVALGGLPIYLQHTVIIITVASQSKKILFVIMPCLMTEDSLCNKKLPISARDRYSTAYILYQEKDCTSKYANSLMLTLKCTHRSFFSQTIQTLTNLSLINSVPNDTFMYLITPEMRTYSGHFNLSQV